MNQKDLEYLRTMAEKSETEDFSDKELEKISSALRTNVNANDTTEALDLTAQIVNEQAQSTNIHGENRNNNMTLDKLHSLAKEVIYYGKLLGAKDAIRKVDDFDFYMDVKKENVTDENAKRVSWEDGHSFLYESVLASSSPKTIQTILNKGGKFVASDDPSYELVDLLLYRVTDNDHLKNSEEKNVKNDLENMIILLDSGLADVPVNLDKLLSNPELFERYPNIMKKMFSYDKNLLEKLEDVKVRKENKEQNRDYLQDKLEKVRKALQKSQRRPRKGDERKKLTRNYRMGETGEVTRKNLSENNRPSKEEIEYGTQIQTEVAKKVMKERRGR